MAHGDYRCCAVCDKKCYYEAGCESSKSLICTDCLKALHKKNIMVYEPSEFIKWIRKQPINSLKNILKELSFEICWYDNEVDRAVDRRLKRAK